jgi:ABC-type Mn2+/Zn2+ transport system permease subunit
VGQEEAQGVQVSPLTPLICFSLHAAAVRRRVAGQAVAHVAWPGAALSFYTAIDCHWPPSLADLCANLAAIAAIFSARMAAAPRADAALAAAGRGHLPGPETAVLAR